MKDFDRRVAPTRGLEALVLPDDLAQSLHEVVDMEKNGFHSPSTVASFLTKGELAELAVVIVDEASMVDTLLWQALLTALPAHAALKVLATTLGVLLVAGRAGTKTADHEVEALSAFEGEPPDHFRMPLGEHCRAQRAR